MIMKINAINSIITLKSNLAANRRISLPAMQNDTFTKTTSFKGSKNDDSFQEFVKWAEKTDFLSNADNIIDKTGRILGSGFEGITIEIPNNDKWVIKVMKRSNLIQQGCEKATICEVPDKLPDLNIGQIIAYVTMPISNTLSRRFYIPRKQKGESYGINNTPPQKLNKKNIDTHISSLKKMAQFPLEAYKQMIRDIMQANDAGYIFDFYNPNNIMLDDENKRINFVDVDPACKESVNYQFSDILYALLDGDFGITFLNSNEDKDLIGQAKKYSDIIKEKFEKAIQDEIK